MNLPPLTDNLAHAKADLAEYGFARIANALSVAELEEARARVDAQAAGEKASAISVHDGSAEPFGSGPNQWVDNLINKGQIFRDIVMKDLTRELMNHLLGDGGLLSSFTCHIAGPGGTLQALHRDSGMAPDETPYPIVANMMWMLDDFTDENGATRIVPGSHKFDTGPGGAEADPKWSPATVTSSGIETVAAEGPAGSALVFDGRLWHGTGANRTDRPRRGILSYHCRGWVRQQENFTLSLAPEVLAACSPELKRILGFSVYGTLGATRSVKPSIGDDGVVPRPTSYVTELAG
jgi:ectoine hydroxylase-related dioxygenase (phytanoyl-CoA dioxygenase family)